MNSVSTKLRDQISELLKPHKVCLVMAVVLKQPCGRNSNRLLVLTPYRGYLVVNKQHVRVESTFSYLQIFSINIHSSTQIVLETDRQTLSLSVLHVEDLEAMVSHMTSLLKRIFPYSSPGKLLTATSPDLRQRLLTLTEEIEEQLGSWSSCGGFSDTYAALCDFNEMPFRDEIQWGVDNLYHVNNTREFNLQDFSDLDSRDLALAVAALSFNHWFTKIYCKELKLSIDIQEQLIFLLSISRSLTELSLEASGLKLDFAIKMSAALREHPSSVLQSINLSGNPLEDKGVVALSQEFGSLAEGLKHLSLSRVSMTARGLGCLSQALSSTLGLSASLTHLDLSGNPGSLGTEDATFLFKFLSSTNSLYHLDLSDTNCPLDTLFVSLSAGCCYKLMHLNLARNPFSHRKVREVTRSIQEFFSKSCELKYVGLSATRVPPQALRFLLQGLATNTHLFGLELDVSSCELRSAGAQVIQEYISEATSIRSLDISDNGFENDMVTLVLSVGRCHSLRRLALGRNFAMKSRALTDVLHRIAQLIQDEECPLESLSVCDSKLKSGMNILLTALSGHSVLAEVDISGNNIGDAGAKMVAKALTSNTRLRTLSWDRNNITARGFQDVADALERNFTLQQVSGLADITQSYRSNPEGTKKALNKIQQCLDRNNQRKSEKVEPQQIFRVHRSEKQVLDLCHQLEDSVQRVTRCSIQEVQAEVLMAQETLHNARAAIKLLPWLYEVGRKCDGNFVTCILSDAAAALTNEFNRNLQDLSQGLMSYAEAVCPRVVQRSSVCESLSECVSKRHTQTHTFLRGNLVENAEPVISNRLRELRQTLSVSLAESIIEQVLQDLTVAQDNVDCLVKHTPCSSPNINIPDVQLSDGDFPTDDYSQAFWRNSSYSRSLRSAPSIKSLQDADWEYWEGGGGGVAGDEGGGGGWRSGLPRLLSATPLSVRYPSSSPSPSPSPPGRRGRRQRRLEEEEEEEEEVVAVDAAAQAERGASLVPPPSLPLLYAASRNKKKTEEASVRRPSPRRPAPSPGPGPLPGPGPPPKSPMEPLPTQGQNLRHYTASRPRPKRTHTQPPSSRTQEPLSKAENEVSEEMGRVDEGVEEFFTKKIIPDYALKGQWEESIPAQATPPEPSSTPFSSSSNNITTTSSSTVTTSSSPVPSTDTSLTSSSDVSPLPTSSPPPPPLTTTATLPGKNIKKKFGDFFAFKRARGSRAAKAGGGEGGGGGGGGGGEGMKVKRTSIADLIRPLREAKERERERERGRERDANVSNDAATTEGTFATSRHLAGDASGAAAAAALTTTTPSSETPPLSPEATPTPPSPVVTPPPTQQEGSGLLKVGGASYGERRLNVTKRTLREGKSQSLILLTGLEPEDKEEDHSKKHVSESTSSFEQRLQVMLHRMGVSKTPPVDPKSSQNKDEELRKANSEGAILDKPVPPPTFLKPRTMSTSSADPRHPVRTSDPLRPDPPLLPKPALPDRPAGLLPLRPAVAAKPPLPTPGSPAGRPSSAPPTGGGRVQLRAQDGETEEVTAQNRIQESPRGAASAPSPRAELLPPGPSPWRSPAAHHRSEKAQSVTDESLPRTRQHLKPLPQRRAVSVHEDALAMTQELKSVLLRSPIRFRGNRGDLATCTEDPASGKEAQTAQEAGDSRNQTEAELKPERDAKPHPPPVDAKPHPPPGDAKPHPPPVDAKPHPPPGDAKPHPPLGDAKPHPPPGDEERCQQDSSTRRRLSPTSEPDQAPSPTARTQTPTLEKKSPSTAQSLEKLSPSPREKTPSSESPEKPHRKKSPVERNSTAERGEAREEAADRRTE